MRLTRGIQAISFTAFMLFLWYAAFPLVPSMPVDLFLRMDPLALVLAGTAGRAFLVKMIPAVLVLILSIFLGRFFCSMVCPLGTSIDVSDRLLQGKDPRRSPGKSMPREMRLVKYCVLAFMFSGAVFGFSLAAYGSPVAIATRFYGLLVYPVVSLAADAGLSVLRPLADRTGFTALAYAHVPPRGFALQWLSLAFMGGIAACALLMPRFWCRYLCPAGAMFALVSSKPFAVRRRVSEQCTSCGLCRKACPMGAIGEDPHETDFSECIVCMKCSSVCPERAIRFSPGPEATATSASVFSGHRRALILAALAGVGAALTAVTGFSAAGRNGGQDRAMDLPLIRPPGSLPEHGFLRTCVGCGECMKACPTNTLQPAGLAAGFSAMFSPAMVPRRGPCDTTCNACGQVCPTGAIRGLHLDEKRHAKVGTAQVLRHRCIASESGKACLVCDEVCPYGAVILQRVADVPVAVPVVDERRCNGCGFCEHYCPVAPGAAIVVDPMDALRLEEGSYRDRSRELGFTFEQQGQGDTGGPVAPGIPDRGLPPGFSD